MQIRPASFADLPRLPEIERSAASAFEGRDVPEWLLSHSSSADDWRPQLEAGTLWVATIDGELAGFLAGSRHGARLHIDEVDVARAHQGRGIGRALMRHALDWARAQGLGQATLTTFVDVPWNAPFYRSLGFEIWPESEAPAEIVGKLESERARGLTNRCAMRLAL